MERPFNFKSLAIAVIAGLLYGTLIFGVFSSDPKISWEAHLFGILWGVVAAVGYWKGWLRWFKPKFIGDRWDRWKNTGTNKNNLDNNFQEFHDEEIGNTNNTTTNDDKEKQLQPVLDQIPPPSSSSSSSSSYFASLSSTTTTSTTDDHSSMFGSNNPYYKSSTSNTSNRNSQQSMNPFEGEAGSEPAWK